MENEAALKSMAKMIQVMLPYEMQYTPKQKSTKVLREIIDVLREHSPQLNEFLGFFNYVLKNMDEKGDSDKVDRLLLNIWAIINNRYPVVDEDINGGLSEDDPSYIKLEWSDKTQGFEEVNPDVIFKVVE